MKFLAKLLTVKLPEKGKELRNALIAVFQGFKVQQLCNDNFASYGVSKELIEDVKLCYDFYN